ncbi:MAG: radical SAM family heme chaperone HemW [Acetivibrionales bacterium]|jgi:oxygen-independent coproporphyrinogen-3 oxidase
MYDKGIGLYIHIPFCKSKCNYCDFNSFAGKEEIIEPYFKALKKEIIFHSQKLKKYSIKTVFFGGGTPSFVDSKYISEVMELIKNVLEIEKDAEISIEANPGTLTPEKLYEYKAAGINRMSIGLQACQNSLLKLMGRIHTLEEFLNNLYQAQSAGFSNINADLIFGFPGQTLIQWRETIDRVTVLNLSHVSAYSLQVEENTPLAAKIGSGRLTLPEDELDREMYHYAIDRLNNYGLKQYEISNFARPGLECKHNLIYWKAEEYLGIGAGAHSYFNSKRFNNFYDVDRYILAAGNNKTVTENEQVVDFDDEMAEFMILGLRLTKGISLNEFKSRFERDVYDVYGKQIETLLEKGLIIVNKDVMQLSPFGMDVANKVFVEFLY